MTAVSNINYYYRQTVESDYVKKTVASVSAIAFYIFRGIRSVALLSISPIIFATVPLFTLGFINHCAKQILESWQRRISNQAPSGFLRQAVHRVESIAVFALKKGLAFSIKILAPPAAVLAIASIIPFIVIYKGSEYIEDISTEISQKALDVLGIPVQLSISLRQLKSILKEWENHALPGENRKDASEKIIDFYKNSRGIAFISDDLYLEDCQLRNLPDIFHYKPFPNIKKLWLKNNQLITLPESINALQKLNYLNFSRNTLSSVPDVLYSLPRNCEVVVSSNRFPEEEVERIVAITNGNNYQGPRITGISIYEGPQISDFNTSNYCIDDFYSILYRSLGQELRELPNVERTETLRSWLHRLTDLPSYGNNYKMINKNIINFLEEANENETFRTSFTNIIQGASETCGDRVALSILHLDIAYQLEKMDLTDMKKLATFLLRGCWAIDLLEDCARDKVKSMSSVDEIEVYLGYPIQLKQELELPISQNAMLYFSCSGLTSDNLDTAKEYVKGKLNNKDEALDQLIQYDKWKEALIRHKGSKMAAIEREKEQASHAEPPDYEAIQNRYNQAIKDLSRQILEW